MKAGGDAHGDRRVVIGFENPDGTTGFATTSRPLLYLHRHSTGDFASKKVQSGAEALWLLVTTSHADGVALRNWLNSAPSPRAVEIAEQHGAATSTVDELVRLAHRHRDVLGTTDDKAHRGLETTAWQLFSRLDPVSLEALGLPVDEPDPRTRPGSKRAKPAASRRPTPGETTIEAAPQPPAPVASPSVPAARDIPVADDGLLHQGWTDGTQQRDGWTCWVEPVAARLASVPGVHRAASEAAPAFIAATWPRRRSAGPLQLATIRSIRAILQRADAPHLAYGAEARLLHGLPRIDSLVREAADGTTQIGLARAPSEHHLRWALLGDPVEALSPELDLGSDAERRFLHDIVPRLLGPSAARWFIPQPSMAALLGHDAEEDYRRPDFVAAPPGTAIRLIVEIDGAQHDQARAVDRARDRALQSAGFTVIRVPVADLTAPEDSRALAALKGSWPDPEPVDSLLVTMTAQPIDAARVALGLTLALSEGAIDPVEAVGVQLTGTEIPLDVLVPQLDLLLSIDRLWAADLMPNKLQIRRGDERLTLTQGGARWHVVPDHPDVRVALRLVVETLRTGVEALPSTDGTPTIVLRTAGAPVAVAPATVRGGAEHMPEPQQEDETAVCIQVLFQEVGGKTAPRFGQAEAIQRVLRGRDAVVLLPTGAGKSLVYQLAGLLLGGSTVCVFPLKALIEDQARSLARIGIERVEWLTSDRNKDERAQAERRISEGLPAFVLVTPERLLIDQFRAKLEAGRRYRDTTLTVVDEAHCVSEWGHDFRCAYLQLGRTLHEATTPESAPRLPILALTGTASAPVLRDVKLELQIDATDVGAEIRTSSFNREELSFDVVAAEPTKAAIARAAVDVAASLASDGSAGIVFTATLDDTGGLARIGTDLEHALSKRVGWFAGKRPKNYPGDWAKTKRESFDAFLSGATNVMVATKAFGMGIDKSDIRWVVHAGMPGSIEAYYQEVGRAGRDGDASTCVLVTAANADASADFLIDPDGLDRGGAKAADLDTQLFFHKKSFAGPDKELSTLNETAARIGVDKAKGSVELPFLTNSRGYDDSDANEALERALMRLKVLGAVSQYRVDYGSKAFRVQRSSAGPAEIFEALLAWVRRTHPGRTEAVAGILRYESPPNTRAAVATAGRTLIDFVYSTIAHSRRVGMYHMWQAANDGLHDGEELRRRILEHLEQGPATERIDGLVLEQHVDLFDWIDLIEGTDSFDPRDTLGDLKRALEEHDADHPGVWLAVAAAELTVDAHARAGLALRRALDQRVLLQYSLSENDATAVAEWALRRTSDSRQGRASVLAALGECLPRTTHAAYARDILANGGARRSGPPRGNEPAPSGPARRPTMEER
ncbi:RecQ family ATP-dependent DNA helicase [Conexibacter sp. W3-3-2]|uniref:RecQ family ATP-dependent DNA helicase n=1 Tax=Conexibacter sp. W3-3-2 TaxID=2675227 RepID=UPI0012B7260F|nr:RecQ family ATP-dependent DNA helicase [Conexibacter sp. W3-3-2]MTD44878.1 RecQ family ATP-dependent DNA helicase [Conexibacter sp. W3-3-2]